MEHELQWAPEDTPSVGRDELDAALGDVMRVGRARRVRRRAVGSGLVVLALVLGGIGVLRQGEDDGESQVRFADKTTTTIESGVTVTTTGVRGAVTTTTEPAVPLPRQVFISQSYDTATEGGLGRIVVFDTKTKKVVRTAADHLFGVPDDMAITPDHKWIYFTAETCGHEPLYRVRVDGPANQQPERVGQDPAYDPEVSPDGAKVAYIGAPECGDEGQRTYDLHILDVATGADRVLIAHSKDVMYSPTWAPDGKSLVVTVYQAEGSFNAVLSVDGGTQDVNAAPRIPAPRPGWAFVEPQFLPDGTLFGKEVPQKGTSGTVTMAIVDARTGQHLRTVAVGDPKRYYRENKADRSGKHLLYISSGDEFGGGGDLRLSSNGGKTVVLATSVWAASW